MSLQSAIRHWESKSALLDHLASHRERMVLVGVDAEAPRAYYSFSVCVPQGDIEVGLISSGFGTLPAASLVDGDRCIIVGHDARITWIEVEPLAVAATHNLGGPFYQFIRVDGHDSIIVVHELGALRVGAHERIMWTIDTDIVQGATMKESGDLVLTIKDGPTLLVSIESGAIIN